jgi:TolA-binding protein
MTRAGAACLLILLLPFAAFTASPATSAAAPKPKETGTPPAPILNPVDADSSEEATPRTYESLVRRFVKMASSDTLGDAAYRVAETAFRLGKFDDASRAYLDFARRNPRNLRVNDALTTHLLIKEARDFEDRPLLAYARARAHREAGRADSAAALLAETVERYPGAKVRHHVQLLLAEMARDRGDARAALRWAVAASDTTGKNRLAPFALRIAAESSIALGEPPQNALAYYKTLLERYPQSPLAPEARARSLVIRKGMPQ